MNLNMLDLMPHNGQGLPQGWDCCCIRPAAEADLKN
jgi:hypothetical protein